MAANVETLFYVNRKPVWHGLGEPVQEALCSADALEKARLGWEVEALPMFININGVNVEVPNTFANTRSSDNSVLGVVTGKYQIVQNKDAFAFTDGLLGNEGVRYETAGSLQNGRKVWMLARMPDFRLLDDDYENYLAFISSHDGKGAIKVACTPIRVCCENTANLAIKTASRIWSTKHMGNMEAKMAEAHRTLELSTNYINNLKQEAEVLAGQHYSEGQFQIFVERLIPIADDASDRNKKNLLDMQTELFTRYATAPDLANIRGTKWGVIQAVSDFATHRTPKRLTDTYQESLFEETIQGNSMIDFAYELLTA
jgi:phage/plasmid-like protein (TIGR03299 family)